MAITSAGQEQMTMVNPNGYHDIHDIHDGIGDNTDYGTETLSAHVSLT